MSRYAILAVLMSLALAVLAGCGSGPGLDETSSGGFAAAIDPLDIGFPPASDEYAGGDEALDAEGNVLPDTVAAASPLKLWLTGGRGLKTDPVSGHQYYPMKRGETRPIRCTWSGGAVTDPPVWTREGGAYGPSLLISMTSTPKTLAGNFVAEDYNMSRPTWIRVSYGGYTKKIWVWPKGTWSPVGQTAPLNASGARLKIAGATSDWATQNLQGFRLFSPKVSGEVALKGVIIPSGSYPGAPAPTWTANQSRLQFVGSATGWTIRFKIKKAGDNWLTAKIGNFAVTIRIHE
jgi:hypothetical protein